MIVIPTRVREKRRKQRHSGRTHGIVRQGDARFRSRHHTGEHGQATAKHITPPLHAAVGKLVVGQGAIRLLKRATNRIDQRSTALLPRMRFVSIT